MKRLTVVALLCLAGCGIKGNRPDEAPEPFLARQRQSAKEYVLGQFRDHDLVIICERTHPEFTQWELFMDIVTDPRFTKNVGNLFTEIGSVNYGDRVNEFLRSAETDSTTIRRKVTALFRDMIDVPQWHCYSYPWMLTELQKFNRTQPEARKISLYPSDCAFEWSEMRTPEQFDYYYDVETDNRDSIMAANVAGRFDELRAANRNAKALVIMNFSHAFLKDDRYPRTGRYLADRYGDRVASVWLAGLGYPDSYGDRNYTIIKDGYWDYLFEKGGKTDVGFDIGGTPFGEADFDLVPPESRHDYTFGDMFTGIIFYKPVEQHRLINGWEGFVTDDFAPELSRRTKVYMGAMDREMSGEEIEEYIWEDNLEVESRYGHLERLREEIDKYYKK